MTLRQKAMLYQHLAYNIYPSKADLLPFAEQAIDAMNADDNPILDGITTGVDTPVHASDLVEELRLDVFLDEGVLSED